jgi:hypothetical protein
MLVNLLFITESTGTSVECQLDTGATCNVMTHETLCDIMKRKNSKVTKSRVHIPAFGANHIEVMDEAVVPVERNDEISKIFTTFLWCRRTRY